MTRISLSLFSALIACAAIASISISSCDNGPTVPGSNGGIDRSKSPQVLGDGDNSRELARITDVAHGDVAFEYDEEGGLVVLNLNGSENNIIETKFDPPISTWHNSIEATFPATGGSLFYEAKDDAGVTEARVDLKTVDGQYVAYPTFTSHPGGGEPLYDVYIYLNGALTGSQLNVNAQKYVGIDNPSGCSLKIVKADWKAIQVSSQCVWQFYLNPCCIYRFLLPDGSIIDGNHIKFVEKNTNGVYVYLKTASAAAGGTANLTINATAAQ